MEVKLEIHLVVDPQIGCSFCFNRLAIQSFILFLKKKIPPINHKLYVFVFFSYITSSCNTIQIEI